MNSIVKITPLGMIAVFAHDAQAQMQDVRPNIVVIVADDLASHEIGCYGGQNIATPNIDRIAGEGVRFTHNFASCAMSVPVRASLYTGLYPARHGVFQNHKKTYSHVKSIAHYLPAAGYRVWRTGKTHTTPRSVYPFEDIPGFETDCVKQSADYSTDSLKVRILNAKQPFCLFVCSTLPHAPWTVGDTAAISPGQLVMPSNSIDSKDFREIYRKYLAEVKVLDEQVGAVWTMLEETGQLDNTLFLFLGEQGPQFPGGKWTCWNYGQSSALIARYPPLIEAGTSSDALVQYEDILPTLMEFAGGKAIADIDGESFLPVLLGKRKTHRQWVYGIHNNIPEGTAYPVRSIQDKRYKLIINLSPEASYFEKHLMNMNNPNGVWSVWNEAAKTDLHAKAMIERFVHRPAIEFYDLQTDPWELKNLANDRQYVERIARMETELKKWMTQQGDTGASMDVAFNNK
jgi:uncharacterized sulfatase